MGRSNVVVLVLATGCASHEPEPAAKAEPSAPVESEPIAVESPPEPDEVPSDTAADPTTPVLDLHVVARSRSPLRLFATTDDTLFVLANAEAIRVPATGALARERQWLAGLADPGPLMMKSWTATIFGGTHPDALAMVVRTESERARDRPRVYRFAGTAWKEQSNTKGALAWVYRGVSPWRDGTTLALRGWQAAADEELSEAKRAELDRAIAKANPQQFDVLGSGALAAPRFGDADILAFASLPSGEVVAVTPTESLHWAGSDPEPKHVATGRGVSPSVRLAMIAANDVWRWDPDGLFHFDGTAWVQETTPSERAVVGFAIDGDTQWIVQGDDAASGADQNVLHQRTAGGPWDERVLAPMPFPADSGLQVDDWTSYELEETDAGEGRARQPLVPMDVRAHDGLWIVARGPAYDDGYRWALLHSASRGAALEIPDPETMRRELLDARPDTPFTGKVPCEVFVPIAVDDVAADPSDVSAELASVALPAGGRMVLLEVTKDGKPAIGVAISVDAPGRAAIGVTKEIIAGVREALGPRAGKPLCQPSIPVRKLDEWSEG